MSTNKRKNVSYPVILTENFLTIIADKEHSITKIDSRFNQAKELYKKRDYAGLLDLVDKPGSIARYSKGKVSIFDNEVTYNGQIVHGTIVSRILAFFKEGIPFESLLAFLENLYQNTDEDIRTRLYDFLEHNNLAITDRGSFIVFKLVDTDGQPPYNKQEFGRLESDGSVVQVKKYEVGCTYVMPRENSIPGGECNAGRLLYCGNRNYWKGSWGAAGEYTGTGRMLIGEVFPQDVCNVAAIESSKIAVCKLAIIDEYASIKDKVLKPVVKASELKSTVYGTKPSGQRFHNLRDSKGHFVRAKRVKG